MDFEIQSAAEFLRVRLAEMPKRGYGQAKKIAEHLRVSTTYMSQVLAGTKPLALEHALPLATYLGLGSTETDFLLILLQKDRAGTEDLRKFYERKIDALRKESLRLSQRIEAKSAMSEIEKAVFYSQALYSAVHVYCATGANGRSLDEIVERFKIARAQASRIIQFLVESNMLKQQGQAFSPTLQGTHLEQGSPYLQKHHANWRLRALQAAEDLAETELMYTVNVSLSEEDFLRLREEMVIFIQKFLKTVYPSPAELIACFNLDWFYIRN